MPLELAPLSGFDLVAGRTMMKHRKPCRERTQEARAYLLCGLLCHIQSMPSKTLGISLSTSDVKPHQECEKCKYWGELFFIQIKG